jgi:competence protein ComEA
MACGPRSERPHPIATELGALPGIGPVIARRIIEGRPYRSVDELERVKGIGKKRLEEIRPLVTVE